MEAVLAQILKARYREGHGKLLRMIAGMDEETFRWRPSDTAHSIAFQVWHAAREEDVFQAVLREALKAHGLPGAQVWEREDLANRWGLDPTTLGDDQAGSGMDDRAAAALALPGRLILEDYARQVFETGEDVVEGLTEQQLVGETMKWGPMPIPVAAAVLDIIAHDEWNTGYIAALRRTRGLPRVIG